MAKIKFSKIRELHSYLGDLIADCDAPAEDGPAAKVGAGEIQNSLAKPVMDAAISADPNNTMLKAFPNLNRMRR